jgi:putative ABC transport system permease protein
VFAHYAVKEIKRRKFRSVTSILTYVLAVSFLIIMVTLAQGYNSVAAVDLRGVGTHFATYIPSSKVCPCKYEEVGPFFRDVYTPTFNTSVLQNIKNLPGVLNAAPCLSFRLENLTISGVEFDSLATQTTVVGPGDLVKGRFPSSNDSSEVLLDAPVSTVSKLNVGDSFGAFGRNFTVVGIVDPGHSSKPAGLANIYAPLGVVQEIARRYGDLYNFAVSDINLIVIEISPTGGTDFINTVEKSALSVLESYAGQSGAIVGYQCGFAARKVVSITEDGAWITSIILFISVALISIKSQFGSVVERTKEIGILKAIGWANSDITGQVFFESLLHGLVGGIIGIGVGYLITFLVPRLGIVSTQNLVLSVEPLLVVTGLSISVVGGLLAGIIPAWRAAKLQPVEALRHF